MTFSVLCLTEGFCSTGSPEITKFALKSFAVILSFIICRVPMSIDIVLATFKDNLLPCSHTLRFPNSMFMVLVKSLKSITECATLMSSAYLVALEHFNAHGKSLI